LILVESKVSQAPHPWGLEFVSIPAGEFIMGCPAGESSCQAGSDPHSVRITKNFEMGKYLVSEGQWATVMGFYDGVPLGAKFAARVSWNDAQRFVNRLNSGQKLYRYRLPTELS
jgi:formylglycine-generating enzyme required for sulfatase activity